MESKTNISVTIKINKEQEEFITKIMGDKINTSEFIRGLINERMKREDEETIINKEIKQHKMEIKKLEIRKREFVKEQKNKEKDLKNQIKNLSENQLKELNDSVEILKENPQFYEGRFQRYKKLYEKDITEGEFTKLLSKFKENIL